MSFIKNLFILLIILLNIFDISFMETFSEDACGADDDMFRWFEQVGNFAERYQVNTDHITETHTKIHLLERKIDENQKRIEENQQNIQEIKRILLGIQKVVQKTQNTLKDFINKPTTIVIQRRVDGSEDFYRTWDEYKNGFGDTDLEFFIGLEELYKLTNRDRYELIITMEDFENTRINAKYNHFVIGSEAEKYVLKSLGNYTGTAGDTLTHILGMKFSTKDQDNDKYNGESCATDYHGAWWYHKCAESNLNGKYSNDAKHFNRQNIYWYAFKDYFPLKFVEMKLRKFHI